MGLVSLKSNFFLNKISQGRKFVREKSTFSRTFAFSAMQKIYLGQHRVVSLWNKTMFLQWHFKQSKLNVAQNSYKKYKKLMNSSLLNSPNQSKSQILFHKKSPHHRNLFDRLCLPPKCLYGKIPDGPNVEIRRKGERKSREFEIFHSGSET